MNQALLAPLAVAIGGLALVAGALLIGDGAPWPVRVLAGLAGLGLVYWGPRIRSTRGPPDPERVPPD